ncbi:MAG: polysaccharide deacetylase family protein [Actinomycetota bacterium]|nr:polysaccharide deacetylase family protein [Actinomycetota bacterium]
MLKRSLRLALLAAVVLVMSVSPLASAQSPRERSRAKPPSRPPAEWVTGPSGQMLLTLEGPTKLAHLFDVLTMLDAADARASFFLPGRWLAQHASTGMLIVAEGHALGNRGFGTERFTNLSESAVRSSIRRAATTLQELGIDAGPFLRPPGGARNTKVLRVAAGLGYGAVRWSYQAGKGAATEIERNVVDKARPGSIVSLQLWRRSHREALPGILQKLRSSGSDLATISALRDVEPVRWDVTLRPGARVPAVRSLQQALRERTYDPGPLDGVFSESTLQAVYAFEKLHGLRRDGIVTPQQLEQLVVSEKPEAPDRGTPSFVDVDLSRQVSLEVREGEVVRTLSISSGSGEYYMSDGERSKAETPTGEFEILWKIPGWRHSDLGELWYPSYFHEAGYAFHGSTFVPPYPDSHGCIRLPMYVTKSFYADNPVGTKVFVHD